MDNTSIIGLVSIIIAGMTIAIGSIGPAIAQGRAVSTALESLARQPDESNTITRTLFVGLALIESFAIYCLLISMILIFFNPFWNQITGGGGG
jgi:F-type H+-transporting ATPase subunit c